MLIRPASLYIDAFSARLLPPDDSWLLDPGVTQLETLVLTNIYPLDRDDIHAIKGIINLARPLPEPKAFSFTVDMEDDDENDSGSEVY